MSNLSEIPNEQYVCSAHALTCDFCRERMVQDAGAKFCKTCAFNYDTVSELIRRLREAIRPVPMLLHCPLCNARHIDEGEFATTKVHHTHACQHCGHVWRPAIVPTVGVQFLPGFKSEA